MMNALPYLLSVLSLTLAFLSFGQDRHTIFFNPDPVCRDTNSYGISPVFELKYDSIFKDEKRIPIVFPVGFSAIDTGYLSIYFTGIENSVFSNSTIVLVQDYSSERPKLWVDHNGNLDFSDDKGPLKVSEKGEVIISLSHSDHEFSNFSVRLLRKERDSTARWNLETYFGGAGVTRTGEVRTDIDYWFSDQRMNIRVFDGEFEGDSRRFGIMDWNCDGLFQLDGEDLFMMSSFNSEVLSYRVVDGAVKLTDSAFVYINGQQHIITNLSSVGDFIELTESFIPARRPIIIGDTLKDYSFEIADSSLSLHEAIKDGEFLIIDVWGSWCGGCHQQTPIFHEEIQPYLKVAKVLGLNYGDSEESMHEFINRYEIQWPNVVMSKEFHDDLNIEGYPTYMLIDSNGVLLMSDSHPFGIITYLKDQD
ncbi:MAG: TlpA family protein disulfide reductase [Flavobacteriia bacterium]|nr:TlpA family protein disulfide reductase [Flavobacteriia bacterium]